jgi:hypothetical protein
MHWTGTSRYKEEENAKNTWKRTREWELQKEGESWQEAKGVALDRDKLKTFK